MSEVTITIVGTGVIGTSLGLALKQLEPTPFVIGHDKELPLARGAARLGAFDKVEWNLINACEPADLIVLAIPLSGVEPTLEAIGPELKEDAVVTDTVRLKGPVIELARRHLPPGVHFVGGDPIVTAPGSGHAHARADLFRNGIYCLTPEVDTHQDAVALVEDLARQVGANPFYLDAAEHDGLVSSVDHLPMVLSAALMRVASASDAWRESRKLAGATFLQATAGVGDDPVALQDALLLDKENILHWIDNYAAELESLRELIAAGNTEALADVLDKTVVEREKWVTDFKNQDFTDPELKTAEVEKRGFMRRLIGIGR